MTAPRDPNKHLVTARLEDVVDVFKVEARNDAAILDVSRRAAELESAEEGAAILALPPDLQAARLAELGLTKKELRVAVHASKPRGEAPVYLLMAQERHLARLKALPVDPGSGKGKGTAFVIPVSANDPGDEEPQP